jgi:hypothetical protein
VYTTVKLSGLAVALSSVSCNILLSYSSPPNNSGSA